VPTGTLLAVPITAASPPLLEQARSAKAAGADLLELRADLIEDLPALEQFLAQPRELPVILTLRSVDEGGKCCASDAERAALFQRLAALAPDYVDIEFAAWRRSPELQAAVRPRRAGPPETRDAPPPRLILSQHDLHGTPAALGQALEPLLASPADVVKAVFAAHGALDACRVLAQLQKWSQARKLIMLATEPAGLITRVLARKFNAFAIFAALDSARQTAPGQPTLRELVEVYRWNQIGPSTTVLGVVGWPVSHSRSPAIHTAAMRTARIDGVYAPLPVAPTYAAFAAFMDHITQNPHLDVTGLSVTIPHKEHAARWLTEHAFPLSDVAQRVGAVNTLTRTGPANWSGDNTDCAGFLAALALVPESGRERTAAILGAGGAARAAVCALLLRGYNVTVFNRTEARAAALANELGCSAQPWAKRLHTPVEVIVNCTAIGMAPAENESPLPAAALRSKPPATVIDAVYNPAETRLLREARQHGCHIVSGTEVFLAQAAAQFEAWHKTAAPLDVMRQIMSGKTVPA
jgi:3-dehydroquinate dehydratase/shikimate dehydrogenase